MDYLIGFSIATDGEEQNVVDTFVRWLDDGSQTVTRVSEETWFVAPGRGFRITEDSEGVSLRTSGMTPDDLHGVLSSFFEFSAGRKGYVALSGIDEDASSHVVLISNDPELESDPTGTASGGVMRTYRDTAVLGTAALFLRLQDQMFGHMGATEENDVNEDDDAETIVTGLGSWLFSDIRGPIDDAEEIVAIVEGVGADVDRVLRNALRVPDYRVSAGDYFTFDDSETGASVTAQPLPTRSGPVVELRLVMPPPISEEAAFQRIHDAMKGLPEAVVMRVVDYDDIEGTIQANPLLDGGGEGPMRILHLDF